MWSGLWACRHGHVERVMGMQAWACGAGYGHAGMGMWTGFWAWRHGHVERVMGMQAWACGAGYGHAGMGMQRGCGHARMRVGTTARRSSSGIQGQAHAAARVGSSRQGVVELGAHSTQ